jgi:hypothetical protein
VKALEIENKNFGEEHVEYASTLGNLSINSLILEEYDEANEKILKTLLILKSI